MARFRLRYQSSDLELPAGEFVIGRSSGCHLAVDDALVSRRHALLRVSDDKVVLEDLGSRNGVAVNGRKIGGTQTLNHGDRLTIGSQELVMVAEGKSVAARTLQIERCGTCGALNDPSSNKCVQCGAELRASTQRHTRATLEAMPAHGVYGDEQTHAGSTFQLLAGISNKALALGRYEEASRMLSPTLDRMALSAIQSGVCPEDLPEATRFVLRLCEGPNNTRWFRWLFEIYSATGELMTTETIDQLHNLVRQAGFTSPGPLRKYLQTLKARDNWSGNERFRLRRLEGLERVITAQ